MTQEQYWELRNIQLPISLNVQIVVTDTSEVKIWCDFISFRFQNHPLVVVIEAVIKTEVKTANIVTNGVIEPYPIKEETLLLLATDKDLVPVVKASDMTLLLDDEGNPIQIPETWMLKTLAWENPLPYSFKQLIENRLKSKFGITPQTPYVFIDQTL